MEKPTFIKEVEVLKAITRTGKTKGKKRTIRIGLFKCFCGKKFTTNVQRIKNGTTKSCGCLFPLIETKYKNEYGIWSKMKDRCCNKNTKHYNRYGGRGITVCQRWKGTKKGEGFSNFIKDMGSRPSPKHSIDRINNNGNYEPSNCRWATSIEQANNKETYNFVIEYNGESHTATEWARIKGLPTITIRQRIKNYNWSIEKAIETPLLNNRTRDRRKNAYK